MLKKVAFAVADGCSYRQLKGNFGGSGCLMDLYKQTKWKLSGFKEGFGLQDTQRNNAGEKGEGRG